MMKEANFAEFRQVSLFFDEFSGLKDYGKTAEGKGDYFCPITEVFLQWNVGKVAMHGQYGVLCRQHEL